MAPYYLLPLNFISDSHFYHHSNEWSWIPEQGKFQCVHKFTTTHGMVHTMHWFCHVLTPYQSTNSSILFSSQVSWATTRAWSNQHLTVLPQMPTRNITSSKWQHSTKQNTSTSAEYQALKRNITWDFRDQYGTDIKNKIIQLQKWCPEDLLVPSYGSADTESVTIGRDNI